MVASRLPDEILVTGAAGFIAFHLIEHLLAQGVSVVGIDSFEPFYPRALKERNLEDLHRAAQKGRGSFEFIEKDILELEPGDLSQWQPQCVVHLAAKAGVRGSLQDPESYLQTNVVGTLRVLEFCRARGINELVFGSSSSVYGDTSVVPFVESAVADSPVSPYAASKRSAELLCSTYATLYGLRAAVLRFFTVYGPRQRPDLAIHKFAKRIAQGEPVTLFGDGSTSRDYTFVTDIVAGIIASVRWAHATVPGACEVFNLGSASPVTLAKLLALLEEKMSQVAVVERHPPQLGDVERTFADISKSGERLGYAPKVTLAEGIERFVEWFQTSPEGGFAVGNAAGIVEKTDLNN